LLPLNTEEAYKKAKKLLSSRFGNAFLVSDAYRKKINDWPKISPYDGPSLRKFSDFLEHCKTAMEEVKYLNILNDPDENQKMLKKLPSYLVTRWSHIVDKWIEGEDYEENNDDREHTPVNASYPPFAEFCKFLKKEARIACNPITSPRALKGGDGKEDTDRWRVSSSEPRKKHDTASSFAIGSREIKGTAEESKKELLPNNNGCPLCKEPHDLDSCKYFLMLTLSERKDLTRSKALRWGCLRYGHRSRQCRKRKSRRICEGSHHSSLHDESFNPHNEASEPEGEPERNVVSNRVQISHANCNDTVPSHSLIVPVWLCHLEDPEKELIG